MTSLFSRQEITSRNHPYLPPKEGIPVSCTSQEVLDFYRLSSSRAFTDELFAISGALRDRYLGKTPWWSACLSAIAANGCDQAGSSGGYRFRLGPKERSVVAAVGAVADLGIGHVRLVAGRREAGDGQQANGYDRYLIDLVAAIRGAVDIEVEVDFQSLSTRGEVRALKELGVFAINCPLETLNPDLYRRFNPQDDLQKRIRLMELCEEEGVPIRTTMQVGLGETDGERIEHLLFLRRFNMLGHLSMSLRMPFPEMTTTSIRFNPWPIARLTAIARLLYPWLDLSLAACNDRDNLALWWMAGGGNQIVGADASMNETHNRSGIDSRDIAVSDGVVLHDVMSWITAHFGDLGLTPGFIPFNTVLQRF